MPSRNLGTSSIFKAFCIATAYHYRLGRVLEQKGEKENFSNLYFMSCSSVTPDASYTPR